MAASSSKCSGAESHRHDLDRDEKIIRVKSRVYVVVHRSLCEKHMDEFESLREGLCEFTHSIADAEPIIEEEITAFFPDYPLKIDSGTWSHFKAWLKAEIGEPIRKVCLPWCKYGIQKQKTCQECANQVGQPLGKKSEQSGSEAEVEMGGDGEQEDEGEQEKSVEAAPNSPIVLAGPADEEDVEEGDDEEVEMALFFVVLREWVQGHLFHSVQKSMCATHFQEFEAFHDGLVEVAQAVTLGRSVCHGAHMGDQESGIVMHVGMPQEFLLQRVNLIFQSIENGTLVKDILKTEQGRSNPRP
ncbi:hypothetical protein FRX31_008868 [Thalictrum thalictroides]|uniref:Uncharacterized protein n=1 Tax=Thalictrum thalictroides TaxID=46969 RepID=A0A7J6WVX9_THATH|nr:hypothetical protein FRX31_008868 [Thalictrum thalictroides]